MAAKSGACCKREASFNTIANTHAKDPIELQSNDTLPSGLPSPFWSSSKIDESPTLERVLAQLG